MASESIDPMVLVNHDGELVDVLALLSEAGVGVIDRRGPPTLQDARTPWQLVIATPKRIVKLDEMDAKHRAVRLAIVDGASRTLRSMLQRMAIDFVVRRPVHPTALRLLILRSLYRGPEKRGGGARQHRSSGSGPLRISQSAGRACGSLVPGLSPVELSRCGPGLQGDGSHSGRARWSPGPFAQGEGQALPAHRG